jgi:hypothetical protein
MKLRLVQLTELEHVQTRLLHPIDRLVERMRSWPAELPPVEALPPARVAAASSVRGTVRQAVGLPSFLYALGVPPVLVCTVGGALVLIDGQHRLTAARRAGLRAFYAVEIPPRVPERVLH